MDNRATHVPIHDGKGFSPLRNRIKCFCQMPYKPLAQPNLSGFVILVSLPKIETCFQRKAELPFFKQLEFPS